MAIFHFYNIFKKISLVMLLNVEFCINFIGKYDKIFLCLNFLIIILILRNKLFFCEFCKKFKTSAGRAQDKMKGNLRKFVCP